MFELVRSAHRRAQCSVSGVMMLLSCMLGCVSSESKLLTTARQEAAEGRPEVAVGYYTEFLKLEPASIPALLERGAILSQRRSTEDAAIADFERVLELDYEQPAARRSLLDLYLARGDADRAEILLNDLDSKLTPCQNLQ